MASAGASFNQLPVRVAIVRILKILQSRHIILSAIAVVFVLLIVELRRSLRPLIHSNKTTRQSRWPVVVFVVGVTNQGCGGGNDGVGE